ncbi:MAG: type II toxin-antitoxin system VapB family antitoxin [bacterium]
MALNIKNPEVERLVVEVVSLTGETKTQAILRALQERQERLALGLVGEARVSRLRRFLDTEVWPRVPERERGRRLSREQEDAILGYGAEGV